MNFIRNLFEKWKMNTYRKEMESFSDELIDKTIELDDYKLSPTEKKFKQIAKEIKEKRLNR